MANCVKCGKPLDEGVKFCVSCGTPVTGATPKAATPKAATRKAAAPKAAVSPAPAEQEETAATSVAHCENCGKPLKEGMRFCVSCGTPVGGGPPAPQRPAAPPTAAQTAVLSTGEWLLTLFVFFIPLVGLIMAFVWAFGSGNLNRRNYCRAYLILAAVGFVLGLILLITYGSVLAMLLNF